MYKFLMLILMLAVSATGCTVGKWADFGNFDGSVVALGYSGKMLHVYSHYYNPSLTKTIVNRTELSGYNKVTSKLGTNKLNIFIDDHLFDCTKDYLKGTVEGLLARQYQAFLGNSSFDLYFIVDANIKIYAKPKKLQDNKPIEIFLPFSGGSLCSKKTLLDNMLKATSTIVHESFHLYVRSKSIDLSESIEEKIAYQMSFCNLLYTAPIDNQIFALFKNAFQEDTIGTISDLARVKASKEMTELLEMLEQTTKPKDRMLLIENYCQDVEKILLH